VADVLGLVLEKYGMENLDAVDTPFVPGDDTPWEQTPTRFAAFVKQTRPKSDYALYAEYLGDPKSGPTEVRWLIVKADGTLVLSDRQTPADADFKRIAARDPDPMGCSTLVAERLVSQLHWKRSAGSARSDGKFARLWAEKSGSPNDAERSAMTQRLARFKAARKSARIGVCATRVNDRATADSAARLSKLLAQQFASQVTSVEKNVLIEIKPTSNQQKRLWDLARGFREHLRSNPPEQDYALLAEYLINPTDGSVHAVNFVLCDKAGDWVIVDFQNDQQVDFQRVSPRNIEDCERLTAERLAGYVQ
jgi:hypothetical protein